MTAQDADTQAPKSYAQALFAFLPPLLVAVAFGWLLLRPAAEPTPLLPPSQGADACKPTEFQVGYRTSPRSLLPEDNGGYTMLGRSWLTAHVCGPGTLSITARGQQAGGQAPTLAVGLNNQTLAHKAFTEPRTVRVQVPQSGRLTLAYLNDFYQSEARAASLHHLQLLGAGCDAIDIHVPPGSGAWVPERQQLLMPTTGPVTLQPCGAGTLQFQAEGRAAAGEFPMLRAVQAGQPQTIALGPTKRLVRLEVTSAQSLALEIMNPYFAELADRNLYIEKLEFVPNP